MLEVTLTVTCLTLPIKGLLLIRVNVYGTEGWVGKEWSIKKRTEGKRVKRRSGTVWHYKTLLLHKSGSQHASIQTYTSKTTPLSPEKPSGEAQTERDVKKSYKRAMSLFSQASILKVLALRACVHVCWHSHTVPFFPFTRHLWNICIYSLLLLIKWKGAEQRLKCSTAVI